jgi:hypothetical protein
MKQKITMLIDAKIIGLAKQRAFKERRLFGDLIEEALSKYLHKDVASLNERKMAYHLFCERPMKIPRDQLQYVLEEDV